MSPDFGFYLKIYCVFLYNILLYNLTRNFEIKPKVAIKNISNVRTQSSKNYINKRRNNRKQQTKTSLQKILQNYSTYSFKQKCSDHIISIQLFANHGDNHFTVFCAVVRPVLVTFQLKQILKLKINSLLDYLSIREQNPSVLSSQGMVCLSQLNSTYATPSLSANLL